MSKRFLMTIITLVALVVIAGIAILFAKGYSFSPKEKRIVGSGIMTITSEPDAASVFLDGHLTTATNTTIASLSPKIYNMRIVKEGFIPWEKPVAIKEGLVTEVKVTLFPAIPTIYPLTFTGVENPVLSLDGGKLAYVVPNSVTGSSKKAGIWVWTQTRNQPISFARSAEPHQIAQNTVIDFSGSSLKWSADSKQVLATVGNNNYLLDADKLNSEPRDITPMLSATMQSWEEDSKNKEESRIEAIKDVNLRQIASSSAVVRWSPDETKFMVVKSSVRSQEISGKTSLKVESDKILNTEDSVRVYDLEDKKEYIIPAAKAHVWLPDSRYIILVEEGTISVVDFDGTNRAVIYAGSFKEGFVFPWLDSSRIVIISSIPTPTASKPNLYGINLK